MSGGPLDVLRSEPALLLAVSGGPDSTALLLMAAEWAGGPALYVATVDHGLRAESAAEAEAVAALAARLGLPHAILRWDGDKPATRLQERAREARYGLLEAQAKRVGARVIVTAHHRDDQAETVLMRLARGSGVAGLAGMAARVRRGEVEIARPLLDIPKAELVAYCEARGVAFARDPSNENMSFARPRLRRLAQVLASEGLDAAGLARLARRAGAAEEALARMAEASEARLGLARKGRCEAGALAAEPLEIVRRVLARAVGEPPFEAMERIAGELVAAIARGERYAANIAGKLIVYERDAVTVAPEPPRRAI